MFSSSANAQLSDSVIYSSYFTDNLINDQQHLEGIKLSSSNKIIYVAIDSITNLVTIKTKYNDKRVTLMIYDLGQKKMLWTRLVNHSKYKVISLKDYILLTSDDKTQCFNKYTGDELWNSNREVLYVNEKNDVAFTYFTHFDASHPDKLLEAVRLYDGRKIWKREIDRHYGWNEIQNINDSTILLSASGLHTIHLKTGKGWDFDALTGEILKDNSDQLRKAAFIATTIAFGVFAGISVYYFTHTNELLWELCSNIIINEDKIFYASKKTLTALDLKGKVIWQTKLPHEITGNSNLELTDSLIVLVNKGYAAKGQTSLFYGTPYIATFNKLTGVQNFIKKINLEENAIRDFKINNGVIYLIQKERLSSYSLTDGEFQNRTNVSELLDNKDCEFKSIKDLKIKDNGLYTNNYKSDSMLYVFAPQHGLIIFNTNINEVGRIKSENLFIKVYQNKDYQLFSNKEELIITDTKSDAIMQLRIPTFKIYKSNRLYYTKDNNIYLLDWSQFKH